MKEENKINTILENCYNFLTKDNLDYMYLKGEEESLFLPFSIKSEELPDYDIVGMVHYLETNKYYCRYVAPEQRDKWIKHNEYELKDKDIVELFLIKIKEQKQQEQAEQPQDDYYTRKHDKGKPKLLQVPVEAITAISEIMDYGSNKYGANSWQQVEIERYLQAGVRHIYAIQEKDEQGRMTFNLGKKDEESGIEHLKHALCNLAYAVALYEMKKADNEK